MAKRSKLNKILLVEGNDDQHVIWALCQKFKVAETFSVEDCKGISPLLEQIPVRLKQSKMEAVGIIIDADMDIAKRWQQLKKILDSEGTLFSNSIPEEGFIGEKDNIKIGVWIMPNNNLNGMLEDFIAFLIPKEDTLELPVKHFLQDIESKKLNKYKEIHASKAFIHSWLALQEDPGTPMGLAITKKYLSTEKEQCLKLINWLNKLFNEATIIQKTK